MNIRNFIAYMIVLSLFSVSSIVIASDTATVDLSFSNTATAGITTSFSDWNPTVGLGEVESTSVSYFQLNNTGNVTVDVNVNATNTEDWTIGASPGHDTFKLTFLKQTGAEQIYEQWTTYNDRPSSHMQGDTWFSQEFKVGATGTNETFYITKCQIYLHAYDTTNPGTLTISIRNSNYPTNHQPTGADLTVGTMLPGTASGWKEVTFDTPYELTAGERYCIVARLSASDSNTVWGVSYNNYMSENGQTAQSGNAGETWSTPGSGIGSDWDFNFKVYGATVDENGLNETLSSFATDFSPATGLDTISFGLKYYAPTSVSKAGNQNGTITFSATAH